MARTGNEPGLYVVAAVAVGLGLLQIVSGVASLAFVVRGLPPVLLTLAQIVAGVLLLPAGVGIALRKGWGQTLGIAGFAGVALLQATPLLSGGGVGVPVVGLAVSLGCTLYLLFAGEAFEQSDDERPLSKDESAHDFVR
jgi:hypothetical protein